MRRRCLALVCIAAALLAPPALRAQDAATSATEPALGASRVGPTFSLGAGIAMGQGTGVGLHLLGTVQFEPSKLPFALRVDGQLSQWDRDGATSRIDALTANAVLPLRASGWRPYLLAGGGAYAGSGTGLRPGWNAGLGLEVPVAGRSMLLEWRYHQWAPTSGHRTDYYAPLTIGIRF